MWNEFDNSRDAFVVSSCHGSALIKAFVVICLNMNMTERSFGRGDNLLGGWMQFCDFVHFVFVVESHQINVTFSCKLDVAPRFRGVGENDAGRFNAQ